MSRNPVAKTADLLHRARNLYNEGRYTDAEEELMGALASGAQPAAAYTLLADIQHGLNRPSREAHALEKALAAGASTFADEPEHIWIRLGAIRASQSRPAAAVPAYEQALRTKPDNFAARYGLAQARLALQDLNGARRCVEDLEQRFPNAARAHLLAGHVYKAFGDTAQAKDSYRRALEREPGLGEALYNLVEMDPPGPDDPVVASAVEIATCEGLPAPDRINARFALARIFDRAGRYVEAFEQARLANSLASDELSARGIEYVPAEVERRIMRTMADYPARSFRTALEPLPIELTPVFIIGLPRSGTTLIEQIIASHGSVQGAGERLFARRCERQCRESRSASGRTGWMDPSNEIDASLLEAARERYIEDLFECGLDASWVVDKLPANFEIAGFLRSMFPQAPLIHCVRDPRATCFSLYWSNFVAHEPWYHDLGHVAHYYRQYRRLMAHWRRVIPGPFVEVMYEDLVRSPHDQIAELVRRMGLSPDPACAEFYAHERPILTASHARVRRPIDTSAMDHWRHYAKWIDPIRDLEYEE